MNHGMNANDFANDFVEAAMELEMRRIEGKAQESALQLAQKQEEPGT